MEQNPTTENLHDVLLLEAVREMRTANERQAMQMAAMQQAMQDEARRRRRSAILKFVLVGLFLVFYLLGSFYVTMRVMGAGSAPTTAAGPYAALVRIQGEILPGKPASAERLSPLLTRAFEDRNATAVVLLINSPGGTPVQSALIHDRIKALKAKHPEKKVIAVGEDMLTSGAYMVAVAADEIVVNRSTVTGSIGVISRGFGFTGLMERLGIERRVMTAGESKNLLDPFGPQTDEDRAKQAELLATIHDHFIDIVRSGRGERLDLSTPGLFSGTVWTGDAAVRHGIVDSLGDLTTVREKLNVSAIREYAPQRSFIEGLIGEVSTQVAAHLSANTAPVLAVHPEH